MKNTNLQNFISWHKKYFKPLNKLDKEPDLSESAHSSRINERSQIKYRKDYKCPNCEQIGLRIRRKRQIWECRFCKHIIAANNRVLAEHVLSWKEL